MSHEHKIYLERIYDEPTAQKTARLLVDRVWPRGIAKAELAHDDWIKGVAPSAQLRKWFGHDPEKWGEFRNRYLHELANNEKAVARCLTWCRKGPVTLLYGTKDRDHNQAVVLKDYLSQRLKDGSS